MNVKFYDPELEERFRDYCDRTEQSMNRVINEVIKLAFSLELSPGEDVLKALAKGIKITNTLDWSALDDLLAEVRNQSPLARRARTEDLASSVLAEGIEAHRKRYGLSDRE